MTDEISGRLRHLRNSFPTASFFYLVQYAYSSLMTSHGLSCLTLKATAEALRVNVDRARHLRNACLSEAKKSLMCVLCAPVLTFTSELRTYYALQCSHKSFPWLKLRRYLAQVRRSLLAPASAPKSAKAPSPSDGTSKVTSTDDIRLIQSSMLLDVSSRLWRDNTNMVDKHSTFPRN